MKKILILMILLLLVFGHQAYPATLKEMYDKATAAHGYDKYIELETGITYTGGLLIGRTFNRITAQFEGDELKNVRIVGNGAILDLQGQEICISYCENVLDIDDCVILDGNIRYRGYKSGSTNWLPVGSVRYITMYKPQDYGIRITGAGKDILVERNIVVDTADTGPDFSYLSGHALNLLPTGGNFSFSGFMNIYGFPMAKDNWSFHSDPVANGDPIRHFNLLCEYG